MRFSRFAPAAIAEPDQWAEHPEAGRRLRLARVSGIGLGLVVCFSIFADYPTFVSLLRGADPRIETNTVVWLKLTRDAVLACLDVWIVSQLVLFRRPPPVTMRSFGFVLAGITWVGVVATYSALFHDFGWRILLVGAQGALYVLTAWIGFSVWRATRGGILTHFLRVLAVFVAIQAAAAVAEVMLGFSPLLSKTTFGARAFGTLAHPNLFASALTASAASFLVGASWTSDSRLRRNWNRWAALCLGLIFLTGSRTAMIAAVLMAGTRFYVKLHPWMRMATTLLLPPLVVALTFMFSNQAFSGRTQADPLRDGRLFIWNNIFEAFRDPANLLFGTGLGRTSSTAQAVGETAGLNSHNAYIYFLANYGLLAATAFVVALLFLLVRARRLQALPLFVAVFVMSVSRSWPETFPTALITWLFWGFAEAYGAQNSLPDTRPRPGAAPVPHAGQPGSDPSAGGDQRPQL